MTLKITVEMIDLFLNQVELDRPSSYWGPGRHENTLDEVYAWLTSLRDWTETEQAWLDRRNSRDIIS